MPQPHFLDLNTAADLAAVEGLQELAQNQPLVLRFSALSADESRALIARLCIELPEHAVFQSHFDANRPWITILPLVRQAIVREHRQAIRHAINAYVQTCATLMEQYTHDALPPQWAADEHGEHCQFVHQNSGQTVEAPFHRPTLVSQIDPYFWAVFVKSTAGLESVAALIQHDFHDAARILQTMAAETEAIESLQQTP